MWQQLFELQREIYGQVSAHIRLFAESSGWLTLLAMLPMGVLFGAAHALTPGHSKAVLATYVAGSPVGIARALLVSLTLSLTHVTMAVLIAVFSLPLVSIALGSVGRAPALENISRGLLAVIGVWMIWRALRHCAHHRHEGEAVGFIAGIIPCPLTLFVMTFAISRGVPEAGLVFAVAMMLGVAITLSIVVLLAAVFRVQMAHLLEHRPVLLHNLSRVLEGAAGVVLLIVVLLEIMR
jgi:ABC-type nickel/cobalt efflux system permease component RcnA